MGGVRFALPLAQLHVVSSSIETVAQQDADYTASGPWFMCDSAVSMVSGFLRCLGRSSLSLSGISRVWYFSCMKAFEGFLQSHHSDIEWQVCIPVRAPQVMPTP